MPSPNDIVDIDVSTTTGTIAKPTYNTAAVIGRSTDAPDGGYNQAEWYSDPNKVATDYGDGSDVHESSKVLDAMGVEDWIVIVLEEKKISDEVVGNSDTSTSSSGEVSEAPVAGSYSVDVRVDGTSQSVTPVTETPPGNEESPGSGEAKFNYETGQLITGDSSSGSGEGIQVTYNTVLWTEAKAPLEAKEVDLAIMADTGVDKRYIGDLDELVTWASANKCGVIACGPNSNNYPDDEAARIEHEDISDYVQAGNLLWFARKSPDDAAAYILGQCATNEPFHDPMYYSGDYPGLTIDNFRKEIVGEPGEPDTFEGGNSDGTGQTNVLITAHGKTVLSNSLTTAGEASDYRFFDVWRTEKFIAEEAERALVALHIREDKIPFTSAGKILIEHALKDALAQYVGASQPFLELNINVPERSDLSDDNIQNRIFGPITIDGTLSSNAHQFDVGLNVSVA